MFDVNYFEWLELEQWVENIGKINKWRGGGGGGRLCGTQGYGYYS